MNKNRLCRIQDFVISSNSEVCQLQKNVRFYIVPNVFWYSVYKTSYTAVRPLMNCLRGTITMACVSTCLPIYPDLSNLKMGYSRNRIRRQILPTIKLFLNPKVEKALFVFSESSNVNKLF